MSKYEKLKYFKEIKAGSEHLCSNCGRKIYPGNVYYAEDIKDKFLHSLHRKKLCKECYELKNFNLGALIVILDSY